MKRLYLVLLLGWSVLSVSASELATVDIAGDLMQEALKVARSLKEKRDAAAFASGAQTPAVSSRRNVKYSAVARSIEDTHHLVKDAADFLVEQYGIERERAVNGSFHSIVRRQADPCFKPALNCNAQSRFRTFDGTCNNLRNPYFGAVNIGLRRALRNAYQDGFEIPRGGFNSNLPNERVVSRVVHTDSNQPSTVTSLFTHFGQFLDHDITLTPEAGRQCCNGEQHEDCWPIVVPSGDRSYPAQACLDFTRSTPFCTGNVREQMNSNTAFVDSSQMYGLSAQRALELRRRSGGFLMENSRFSGLLPINEVNRGNVQQGPFVSGDPRVNTVPALVVLHTVWAREHNRLANEIGQLRPSLGDEGIFQLARRILQAEMQHIVYNEYLPVVVGDNAANNNNLFSNSFSTYNEGVDPSIFNAFSTAAFRFGHSLVQGPSIFMRNGQQQSYNTRDHFFNGNIIQLDGGQGMTYVLEGLLRQPAQTRDPWMTQDLTDFLFRQGNNLGSDLAARNIKRGRDHGLPPYMEYRRLCGLSTSSSFGNRLSDVPEAQWNQLRNLYRSPEEIDLFTGLLVEFPANGAVVGATGACLIGEQFSRLKEGDRYFFTHSNQAGSFSAAQLNAITSRNFGDIICDVSSLGSLQSNVFRAQSSSNPTVSCANRRGKLDVRLFL